MLCWLVECYFVVLLEDYWSHYLFLSMLIIVEAVLIRFNLELVSVLERPLIWVLEVDCYCDWKFSVTCIMDFERGLIDCYEWLWETFVDLKVDLFNKEREILLFHRMTPVLICGRSRGV